MTLSSANPTNPTNPTRAAQPTRKIFDAWNSSSTGHQHAENRLSGSTGWRDSRSAKLGEQFRDGQRGGKRMYDTVGAGAKDFGVDGRLESGEWERGAKGLRKGGQTSLWEAFDGRAKAQKPGAHDVHEGNLDKRNSKRRKMTNEVESEKPDAVVRGSVDVDIENDVKECDSSGAVPAEKQIFRNLTIYINGSTAPLVSDHKLKRMLAERGARLSIALGRRSVTHVIISVPNGSVRGAGGGLASTKIQKEISNVKGRGIKFVSVEWVLESVKAEKRLPESKFACLKLASKGQSSVLGMLGNVDGAD